MGNKAGKLKKEKLGHPFFFYEGVKAAHEGRYSSSEIFFENALGSHPGRDFWVKLNKGINMPDTIIKHSTEGDSTTSKTTCDEDTVLELILDEQADNILDYIRLSLDIMHTYLSLTPNKINGGIALAYCVSICRGTRDLNHLLRIWAREAGKTIMSPEMVANTVNPFKKANSESNGEECVPLCMIVTTIWLFQSTLQHYWNCACINYCVLLLQYTQNMESKSQVKHKARAHANILDLSSASMFNLHEACNLLEYTSAAKDLNSRLPKTNFTLYLSENPTSKNNFQYQVTDTNTHGSKKSNRDIRPSIFGPSTVTQPFFYHGRRINLENMISPFVREDPPIRLSVKTQISRNNLVHIKSAGKRDTYYYLEWFFTKSVSIVPGHNLHFLRKDLPYYIVKLETIFKKSVKNFGSLRADMTSIIINKEPNPPSDFFQGISVKVNSDEDHGAKGKSNDQDNQDVPSSTEEADLNIDFITENTIEEVEKISLQNYENTLLNFKDDTTLRLLTIEEAFLTQVIIAVIKLKILKKKKHFEDAERLNEFVRNTAISFYGNGSHELEFIFNIESYINI
ncbi:unnamed protein product [Phytomonas sp. Hart1]|nr:unnamed protein product [Phytomonas sp. Hart1]|eukprot:CCW71600.1 unnamed protein product [Phytomonas sp. isolate Hart1]